MVETFKLKVQGMSCAHCQYSIESALSEFKDIQNIKVDLKNGIVSMMGDKELAQPLIKAINELGFTAQML